jgi:hypothetical protein
MFNILQTLDPESWIEQKQIVYSTVNDWDNAYQSYLVKNNIDEVKFPFATLTRSDSQEPFSRYNDGFKVWDRNTGEGSLIRPVQIEFELVIYRRDYINLESIADFIIVQGTDVQKYTYFSNVLGQQSEFSFHFETPSHSMVAGKEEKLRGNGFIYSLTVPVVVDCILGTKEDQKLITKIVQKTIQQNTDIELDENILTEDDL